jgi:hypothetical protein
MMSDLTGDNKAIRFPKGHFLGYIGRPEEDELPLAFMTEDGTDKAAEKRKESVQSWVNGNSYSRNGEKKIATFRSYDNKPLVGFRLGRSIRRYSSWGSGNVKWRIEDPRGFELEISSPNMAQIAASCVLQNGEILDECIWARLKGDNVLVPVSSELYQAVLRNQTRLETRVKPSQCERGDHIVLQNGTEGMYLGKFESYERGYSRDEVRRMFEYQWKSKPVHAMLVEHEGYDKKKSMHVQTFSTFKPSYRTPRAEGPLTPEEAYAKAREVKGYHGGDHLHLSKPNIVYLETDATMDGAMAHGRNGRLICYRDEEMWAVHVSAYDWERYKNHQAAPLTTPTYYSRNFVAWLTKVTRDTEGHYYEHDQRRIYNSYGRRSEIEFSVLENLPLKIVQAWIEDPNGKRSYLG